MNLTSKKILVITGLIIIAVASFLIFSPKDKEYYKNNIDKAKGKIEQCNKYGIKNPTCNSNLT